MITPDEPVGAIPTPRHSPEHGLRAAADSDSTLLDALTTAVCIVSAAWTMLRCNRAAEEAFNVRSAQISGRPLRELFPWLATPREMELYRATLTDGKPRFARVNLPDEGGLCEVGIGRGRGGTLVLDLRPIPDMERELSERIRESESLRELAHRMAADADTGAILRTLAEASQAQCAADAAVVVEVKGDDACYVVATGSLAPVESAHIPLEGSLTQRAIEAGALVNEPFYSERHPTLQQLLPEYPLGPVAMIPLMAHGDRLGVLGVARGAGAAPFGAVELQRLSAHAHYAAMVVWRARMLEQAHAANEAKTSFLATMSHELRTPITALTGYGELLADQILGPLRPEQLDLVERMRSVTHHLAVLIEDMLSFASLEAGREETRRETASAQDIARDAAAVIEPIAKHKSIPLSLDLPDEPLMLATDEDKLRQVLVNLASNAVKFTERGTVTLRVRSLDHEVAFDVIDTGIGIADGDLRKLFQPFVQLDGGLTRRHAGTGLGLYLSDRLTALLGGRIEVESSPGHGSRFSVLIPSSPPA